MKLSRRLFTATAVAGMAMLAALPLSARNVVTYEPPLLADYVASGEPFLLDFSATWCTTCHAQERVLDALQAENPAYDAIPILRVDWDTYRSSELVAELAIPRRSTLVMMQGEEELGRVVAGTGRDQIATLLDLGV